MVGRSVRSVVAALTVGITAVALVAVPAASASEGTFTRITTPSTTTYIKYNGPSTTFPVSGQTSLDVTSVDILCFFNSLSGGPQKATFATNVTVTNGVFSTTATYPYVTAQCRLRAVPTGTSSTDYLGSYAGPLLYSYGYIPTKDSGNVLYDADAVAEVGNGIALVASAGYCGVALLSTIDSSTLDLRGPASEACAFMLPSGNLTTTGVSTAATLRVDGHNAYLPYAVHDYLKTTRGLSVTQTTLTTSFSRAANGDEVVVESAPLVRCSVSDVYPPTSVSCPSLVSAGVTFRRTYSIVRGAHQVRFRDDYLSTGAAHTVTAEYQGAPARESTGRVGYVFPGHSSSFSAATPDQVVTGFGSTAGSMLIRSDIYASADDPSVDTLAMTWSRPPAAIVFAHGDAHTYGMRYSIKVPTAGIGFLGFTESENPTTTGVKPLASVAATEMVNLPTITSPHNAATITGHTTVVKGTLTAGANGLPASLVVNGHVAHITRTSTTTATFAVSFTETYGTHKITATAKDPVGNVRSSAITVRNIA